MSALVRRLFVALLAVVLVLSFGAAPAPAQDPVAPAAARAAAVKPHASIKVSTPRDVPANVVLKGAQSKVLVKAGRGTSASWKQVLKPGKYKVTVPGVVAGGKRYVATVKPAAFTVPKVVKGKKYRAPSISVVLREVKVTTILEAGQITPTYVELRWLVPAGTPFNVVRRTGKAPATQPSGGRVVAASGPRVTDRDLTPGTTYTYAFLVRSGKTWRLASKLTLGTPVTDAPATSTADAPYAVAPNAVRVEAGDRDVVELVGGNVWVRLSSTRATPLVGAGFTLPPRSGLPDGYLGRVAEVAPDGRRIRLEQGGLPDVFSYLDLDVSLAGGTQPLEFVSGAARSRAALAQRAQATGQAAAKPCQGQATGPTINFNGPTYTPGGHVRHQIKSTWGVPHTVEFDVRATLTVTASMDISASAAISCSYALKEIETNLPPIGGIPMTVSFHPSFDVSLKGKVSAEALGGSFTTGAWAKGKIGLKNSYEQGPVSEFKVKHPSIKFEADGALSLGGSFSLGFGAVGPRGTPSAGAVLGLQGNLDIFKLSGSAVVTDPTAGACAVVETTSRVTASFGLRFWAGPFERELTTPAFLDKTFKWSEPQYYPKGCEVKTKTGDVLVSLAWRSPADLDLHVVEPGGEKIWYGHRNSANGGYLDTDANAACAEKRFTPQENVTWPTGRAPDGTYTFQVQTYDTCSSDLRWTLIVKMDGKTVLSESGNGTSPVYTVKR